jgi:geranylgeranyl diphosphate synthase type II
MLVLSSCELFGGDVESAVAPAIGIELFHNFTLLHDDLMDQAPLRRGKETVYKKWNATIAILAGDTMFALANRFMLKTKTEVIPTILDLFNQTAIEVCEGQQYDMNFETRDDVTLAEYMEMIRLKTAVLLAASLKTGAIIAGAGERENSIIYDFGINIGLAFQLMDDLLDVYGNEEKFGKMTGGDIVAGKKTYLYLKAIEKGASNYPGLTTEYQSREINPVTKVGKIKSAFDDLGIYSLTREEINSYWDRALHQVSLLGLPDARTRPLLAYCARLMERDY